MSYFKMFEDPMYDDDGQLCDEDSAEGDWADDEGSCGEDIVDTSPYATINS
jgi:hypothetical protein